MQIISVVDQDQEALVLWNKAVGFVNSGKLDAALEIFIRLAQSNYEGAALAIGRILAEPNTRHTNLERAIDWYRKAVNEENDVRAMVALARIYLSKSGEDNNNQALYLLERAAEFDDVVALSILGELHEMGYIDFANIEIAKKYYMRAAKLGAVFAMIRLSKLSCGEQHFVECIYWRIKGILVAFKIALADRQDIRLWRIKGT